MVAEDIAGQPERKPPRAPLGGQLAWWPFAVALSAVLVLVLVVVGVNVFAGNGTTGSRQQGTGLTAGGSVACPEFYEHADMDYWVPATPAGVKSKKKLVPKLHPTHVTICEYARPRAAATKSLRVSGQRELTGKLDRVADTLRAAPVAASHAPPCATYIRPSDADRYLIGLRYAEAIVWVAAPAQHCAGTSNGVFTSDRNLSADARASYAAGRWISSPH